MRAGVAAVPAVGPPWPLPAEAEQPEGVLPCPRSLYVHVPFCVSACPYCDFVVYAGSAARGPRSRVAEFLDALLVEVELRADEMRHRLGAGAAGGRVERLETVYVGGGTPSLLSARQLARLLAVIDRHFGIAAGAELTIEANPGPSERGDLAGFAAAGVNRLSLGAQSFDPGELRRLGRRHLPDDVADAVREARRARIGSIGLDLLYDVPGQSLGSWRATLEAALALEPDHVSAYALTLDDPEDEGLTGPVGDHLPVRRGARRWRQQSRREQDGDLAADLYLAAADRLEGAGYGWYEISNWARPGHRSRHNLAYWQRRPYVAVGPGAHGFDGARRRYWNAARIEGYMAALQSSDRRRPALPPGGEEHLDPRTARVETAILALRLSEGLAPEAAEPLRAHPCFVEAIAWGCANDLLVGDDSGRLALSRRGRLLAGELFARLV